jgi:hypothetical protein
MDVGAVKMRSFEDCTVRPSSDDDIIVDVVIVAWRGTLISTLKMVAMEDWTVRHSAHAIEGSYWIRMMPPPSLQGVKDP